MGRGMNDKLGYEPWQFYTQSYQDKTGRLHKKRRLMYDRCPLCAKRKRMSATMCVDCYDGLWHNVGEVGAAVQGRDEERLMELLVSITGHREIT